MSPFASVLRFVKDLSLPQVISNFLLGRHALLNVNVCGSGQSKCWSWGLSSSLIDSFPQL
jgi:hypothetical protein